MLQFQAIAVAVLLWTHACDGQSAKIGIALPLRWNGPDGPMEHWAMRHAAVAAMATSHINNRVGSLVANASRLIPSDLELDVDIRDTQTLPSVAVKHAVAWNEEGRHAIIGSYRSAVTGPLALAASIAATPVVVWAAAASSLSDRDTYPTLSRTAISDAVLADQILKALSAMGWKRIALVYINDAWGRGFAEETSSSAATTGMEIVVAAKFALGDSTSIDSAVSQVAASGARVILCCAFDSDIAAVAQAAQHHGLLGAGHAWISALEIAVSDVLAGSPEPDLTRGQLTGWLMASIDVMTEGRDQRFQSAFESEPIHHLNKSILAGVLTPEIVTGRLCDQFCPMMYDAVWTAAIAIGRVGVDGDGAVDKAALLEAMREVSFEGASGQVQYDRETGERDASDLPLLIYNVQPSREADGRQSLVSVPSWRWQSGVLRQESREAPVWPGGERGWVLPHEVLECEAGYVFSSSSLICEPCPRGTEKEGNECVRYNASLGIVVPLRWGGADAPLEGWAVRTAAAATMAAHHINHRVNALVPEAGELLPAGFKLVFDIRDTEAQQTVAVNHAVAWNEEGRHAIIGSYRSAVTGPLALAASIAATPVVSWGSTASSLSDRDTYPTLSRLVVSDAVLARYMITSMKALGWTRIAILYVNDAWGRGFARDATSAANEVGIGIPLSAGFDLGSNAQIEEAVALVAASGARITLCLAFESDIAAVAAAAEDFGLLESGYAWITPEEMVTVEIAANSPDPEATKRRLAGWLTGAVDSVHGEIGQVFQNVLESEPLHHLNSSELTAAQVRAGLDGASCNQFCALVYDAVWTAAIAIGRVGVDGDGAVDKAALLEAMREVSFEGASGQVQYDRETGERDASDLPLILKNIQVGDIGGKSTLLMVAAWKWQSGVLRRESREAPVWPGGERGWVLPHEVLECEAGYVFSSSSLICEPCPRGTEKEGNECVRYNASLGIVVPLRWGGADAPLEGWAVRTAAAATMAAHHINHRVNALVPEAGELLPAGFKLVFDIRDTEAQQTVAVNHAVAWNEEGRHAIIGSYRSAVTGPLALAASIDATPVVVWAASATTLSDRDTYPTLSRTAVTDAVNAGHTICALSAMGWTRIAILYVNDAWGRGFFRDASDMARQVGIDIGMSAGFALGDEANIEQAVRHVAESGARVVVCVAFDGDVPAIAHAASTHGLLSTGHAWVIATSISVPVVLAASNDPERTCEQLTGWLTASVKPMWGGRRDRFQTAFENEPIHHLNKSILAGVLTPELARGECDEYCGEMYDAVWTAAIAIGRVGVDGDGAVDKAALLEAMREVSFEGASGQVQYDRETGERDASDLPLLITNLKPVTSASGKTISLSDELSWQWLESANSLQPVTSEIPVWPGGERGWVLPHEVLECEAGYVFSSSSLICEPCPRGTEKEGNECVRFDANVGILVPLRWGGAPALPFAQRHAASAIMAAHHINHRVNALVPEAGELLPAGFKLVFDIRDTEAQQTVAVNHAVAWNEEGRHAIIGSYRSAVTGPLALAASIAATPVVSWGSTASSLSDRDTYPTLSRIVTADSLVAYRTTASMKALGWSRFLILYVNDAWGRGIMQDFSTGARSVGMEVESVASFAYGNRAEIEQAVSIIAGAHARIVIAAIYDGDVAAVAAAADANAMLTGYAWILPFESAVADVVAGSPHPERTQRQITGWLLAVSDPVYGSRRDRFQAVFESEPIHHLNKSILAGVLSPEAAAGPCDLYCGAIYDAVWTAAIAIGRVGVDGDGAVDKAALLEVMREVSFEGASGQVQYDRETGERDASDLPLLIYNVRPAGRRAGGVSAQVTWEWWEEDGGGAGRLEGVGVDAPFWPGGNRSWAAPHDGVSCAGGSRFLRASQQCEPCPAGQYLEGASQQCIPCPRGTFAAEAGAVQCARCQVGFANETGLSACHACPDNTVRSAASAGVSAVECLCKFGYYSPGGAGAACVECVTGARCEGGDMAPYPEPGFWGDAQCLQLGGNKTCGRWDRFLPCNPAENCKGGAGFACATGRTGQLCLETLPEYSNVGGVVWWSCGDHGELLTIAGMIGVVLVWFLLNGLAAGQFPALNIALLFVQIGSYGLKWHTRLHPVNLAMSVLNFDVDFVSARCLMPWGPVHSFYLQLSLPVLFACAYIFSFLILECWRGMESLRRTWSKMRRQTLKYVVSFVLINYMTLSLKCFQPFGCITFPDNRVYMQHAPSVECWRGSHWVMVALSALYIVGVLLALPLWIWAMLRRHMQDGTLHSLEVQEQWGWLHSAFEAEWKWWEVVLVARRVSIAFIAVIVPEPMLQGAATLVVLSCMLSAHVFSSPFLRADIDVLDFAAICASMLYTLAGILFYPSVTQQAQGHLCSEESTSPFCSQDAAVKRALAVVAFAAIVIMVLGAALLSVRSVRERRASQLAAAHIRRAHQLSKSQSEAIVRNSANREALHELLEGPRLLSWARQLLQQRGSVKYKASSEHYLEVERSVLELPVDLTDSASNPVVEVMRQLCELEGFLDYLASAPAKGVESLHCFVQDMASFVQAAGDQGVEFQCHKLVRFHNRPLVAYWLASATMEQRGIFKNLAEAIEGAASGGKVAIGLGAKASAMLPSSRLPRIGTHTDGANAPDRGNARRASHDEHIEGDLVHPAPQTHAQLHGAGEVCRASSAGYAASPESDVGPSRDSSSEGAQTRVAGDELRETSQALLVKQEPAGGLAAAAPAVEAHAVILETGHEPVSPFVTVPIP